MEIVKTWVKKPAMTEIFFLAMDVAPHVPSSLNGDVEVVLKILLTPAMKFVVMDMI